MPEDIGSRDIREGTAPIQDVNNLANVLESGQSAGGDLTDTYPNPTVARISNLIDTLLGLADDIAAAFGDSADAVVLWDTSDASNHALVIGLGDSNMLHIAQKGDIGTDWNRSAQSNPVFVIHSATTPATDYIELYHNGTTAVISAAGASSINLATGAGTQVTIGASTLTGNVVGTGSNQVAAGDHSHAEVEVQPGGEALLSSDDAEETHNTTGYALKKTFTTAGLSGQLEIQFDLAQVSSSANPVYGRIYVNGSPVGTERSSASTTYQTFIEDISYTAGDTIELYLKAATDANVKARNYRAYGGVVTVTAS